MSVAAGFLATAAVVAGAYLLSRAIADVFLGGASLAAVGSLLAIAAVLAIGRAPLLLASDALAQAAADRLKGRLRADLTERLLALGPAGTDRERSGELTSVVTNGMGAIEAYVASYQPARGLAVTVPLLIVAVTLVLDPPTTLVLVVTGPVLVLLLAVIGGRTGAVTARRFVELRWLSAFFLDMLQGIATLKAFGRSAEQVDNLRSISSRYGDTTMEVLRTAFQTSLVLEWGAAVAVALVAVEISLRLMAGTIPFDRALAVLIIVPEFFLPLRLLASRYHAGAAGRTSAERMFAILDADAPPGRVGGPPGGDRAPLDPRADVTFDGVTLTYPDRRVPALRDLDLTIRGGETLALVGETGAGKSTIARLLLRFIAPDGGAISVGRRSLDDIDPAMWRAHVTWVPQRPHLFHGSIADNIRFARPDASDDEVRRAAADAGVDTFASGWRDGLDTPIGERGEQLSGGQRQRVALARAFLANTPMLVLDEVTSQLDATSEAHIREAIGRLARDRTVVMVSHRMRLVALADRVVVLAAGRIVETGTPTELATGSGPYRRLLDAASAGESGP